MTAKKKCLLTSWDDGLHTDMRLASLLRDTGFKGTFYATTGVSGARELSDDNVEELVAMGHEFGNHGWTHRPFTTLAMDEIREELEIGREQVARFMEPAPIVAPPRGFVNDAIIDVLTEEGYLIRTAAILGRERPRLPLVDPPTSKPNVFVVQPGVVHGEPFRASTRKLLFHEAL